jgi:topoisomerase-4 subunit A
VLEEIEELTNPKIKLGKKALTPEQLALKADPGLLDTMRDESGREAPVRLVFEPKSKNQDQTEFMNMLLAHTSLEPCLDQPGDDRRRWPSAPEGLTDILTEWISFRFDTVTRRTSSAGQGRRPHPHPGRPEAMLLNIDKVIHIIRNRTNRSRR